ncbi:hypothetical protein ACIG53_07140 [Streptomyces bauhiniae]|uniref:hypothetical protein n=1 Tax=Streptomyces bauhiniae TaxID=2340725 RepID=UPI0037D3A9BF
MTMNEAEMSGSPRLLPWVSEDGKPCFLSTDRADSFMSRRADMVEQVQLAMGDELLGHVHEVLTDDKATTHELRFVGKQLAASLRDILRVADSRGRRLGVSADADHDHERAEASSN